MATDTSVYYQGQSVTINGIDYGSQETVMMEIRDEANVLVDSWTTSTNGAGKFETSWIIPYDQTLSTVLTIHATGQTSGATSTTTIEAPNLNLDQLQNGTPSSPANWANGNINGTNSCYAEGNAVPYRYFVLSADGGTDHFFTIQAEATKAGIHAFDYFTDYDLSEPTPIADAGGPCGTISTAPAPGCVDPPGSFPFPDPTDASKYDSIPANMSAITGGSFVIDGPRNLKFYNATVDSVGKYGWTGSTSDRELNLTIYFTVTNTGSVGFFWGGHLAQGTNSTWGDLQGSASVGGAPYHMRAINYDNGGAANQDRSIQNGVICLTPDAAISCSVTDSLCQDSSYTCTVASGADTYEWNITGGSINSGDGTNSVTFTATGVPGSFLELILTACDTTGGCPDNSCCGSDTVYIPIGDCVPCTVAIVCPPDITIECDESTDTANTGVATVSTSGPCPNYTVDYADLVIPGACSSEMTIERTWYALDPSLIKVDSCLQTITIVDTTPPVVTFCPADVTVECDAIPAAGTPTGSDNCSDAVIITYNGETRTDGNCPDNYTLTRTWTIADSCGNSVGCSQTITVQDTTDPTITFCPANISVECDAIPAVGTPTGTDNCTDVVIITYNGETRTDGNCPDNYTLTRTWTIADSCGNSVICSQDISVDDTTPPVISSCPGNESYQCEADVPACDPSAVVASDNCGIVTVTCNRTSNNGSGCIADPLIFTDTFTVADECGNSVICTRTITVIDDVKPTFDQACPGDITVECDNVPNPAQLTASDNCGPATVFFTQDSTGGDCPEAYTLTWTWTATDQCGNDTVCTQIVAVIDTQDPTCYVPNDTTIVLCDAATICLPVSGSDNCDNDVVCAITSGPGTLANGMWCYDAPAGNNQFTVIIQCSDICGNICIDSFLVTLCVNGPPVVQVEDESVRLCSAGELICLPVAIDNSANCSGNGTLSGSSTLGYVFLSDTNAVCFVADTSGIYCGIVTITDSCGLTGSDSFCVTVVICDPPVLPPDLVIDYLFLICDSVTECMPAPGLNGGCGPFTWTVNGQVYSPDTSVCYHLPLDQISVLSYEYIVTDDCGRKDTTTVSVTAIVNGPPTVNINADPVTICQGNTVCVPYSVQDPNGNVTQEILLEGPSGATIGNGQVCFIPTASGTYRIVVQAIDSCGVSDVDTADVQVEVIPSVDIPDASYTEFLCEPGTVCVPVPQATQGTVATLTHNGQPVGNTLCVFIPGSGTWPFELIATDSCGNVDTAILTIIATINSVPDLVLTFADMQLVCVFPEQVCLTYTVTDPDNGITITTTLGSVNELLGTICFTVNSAGTYSGQVTATDSCGKSDTESFSIVVEQDPDCGPCPTITIEKTHDTYQGRYETVSIFIDGLTFDLGGFELLLQYDASALNLANVEPGQFLLDCGWEYFTHRYGASGNCGGSACPSGILRIISIAETNNGANHPTCLSVTNGEMAVMTFLVTNDRTFECQYIPIRFIWYDCGDNTLSSDDGRTLYISDNVYDFDNPIPITDLGFSFPSFYGANASCDLGLGDGKPDPNRCIDFYNGGIDIVCADSIDAPGDVNLNEVPNEIADVVVFSNYFIYGLSAFTTNVEGQIAATDVNADGIVLSVADLVYLIRVVTGDAQPYSKQKTVNATYRYDGQSISVDRTMGGAYLVVDGNRTPTLTADEMEMVYAFDPMRNVTRILVYSMQPNRTFNGDFLQLSGNLVSIEMATYDGSAVVGKLLPSDFALYQNYPNPFNPQTTIRFALPEASEYTLTIYNVMGQVVEVFKGAHEAGVTEIVWDAAQSASGVYFYRLQANEFSDVRKMILLK